MVQGKKKKNGSVVNLRGKKRKYYDALMAVREEFSKQIEFHSSEALISNKNAGETGISTHMADLGSDNALHDMELSLITNEGHTVEQIDEAIERLLSGEYGICLDCSGKISEERLTAKPYALFCIECKSIREKNGGFRPDFN